MAGHRAVVSGVVAAGSTGGAGGESGGWGGAGAGEGGGGGTADGTADGTAGGGTGDGGRGAAGAASGAASSGAGGGAAAEGCAAAEGEVSALPTRLSSLVSGRQMNGSDTSRHSATAGRAQRAALGGPAPSICTRSGGRVGAEAPSWPACGR